MTHSTDLLGPWVGLLGVVVFAAVGLSHLRHLIQTTGQRRSWHACHVLMAVAMAFMFASAWVGGALIPGGAWRLALAAAGLLSAAWALGGGRVNPLWLLTAVDLAAMFYMESGQRGGAVVNWVVVLYLLADAALWTGDAVRRADGGGLVARLPGPAAPRGSTLALRAVESLPGVSLLGDLDVSPSMTVMTLGMAYMVIAM